MSLHCQQLSTPVQVCYLACCSLQGSCVPATSFAKLLESSFTFLLKTASLCLAASTNTDSCESASLACCQTKSVSNLFTWYVHLQVQSLKEMHSKPSQCIAQPLQLLDCILCSTLRQYPYPYPYPGTLPGLQISVSSETR